MRAIGLALAMVATPAVAAEQQFDLICKEAKGKTEMRYRLDLGAGEFCFGKCELVQKIHEVTSGTITLRKIETEFPDRQLSYTSINRNTGEWQWYSSTPRLSARIQDIRGTCEPAPFTGFGSTTRKF